jgi:hypothetical protein
MVVRGTVEKAESNLSFLWVFSFHVMKYTKRRRRMLEIAKFSSQSARARERERFRMVLQVEQQIPFLPREKIGLQV